LVLGASNWKVTPGIRLATVLEPLVKLTPSTVRLALMPATGDVYASELVVSTTLGVTDSAPLVPELRARLDDPSLLVTTDAVTPILAALMAPSSPASVLFPDVVGTPMTCAAPPATVTEMDPDSASLPALAIGVRIPLDDELLV